jgi:hypothetical protein
MARVRILPTNARTTTTNIIVIYLQQFIPLTHGIYDLKLLKMLRTT